LLIAILLLATSALSQTSAPTEPAPPGQTKTDTSTSTSTENGVVTTKTQITATDDLAMGDPLGNRGMTERANAGPPSTQSYCEEGSTAEHCVRAARRQTSPTTWQQDCASGVSRACGYR